MPISYETNCYVFKASAVGMFVNTAANTNQPRITPSKAGQLVDVLSILRIHDIGPGAVHAKETNSET